MTETTVRDAYTERAPEYISMFGSVDKADEQDQRFIARWAKSLPGQVVDVGCGPGHWTAFLTSLGADAEGVDIVPAFSRRPRLDSRARCSGSRRSRTSGSTTGRSAGSSPGTPHPPPN